ncbi:heme-binding protein [Pseudoalteromonas sp. Of7M-16]|uniref:heme-binding protein n=1 Tax=Pseudoalteromonas sp. Of7M-16 TaxID=2917756 RepID=UPI001EF4D53C|nr:heme-binding protein [Pseudoalteromonas sp. Of7M-16]MCG7547506.1 heme-binding protein [Pseudoalteromonas sp. Of7M-16]
MSKQDPIAQLQVEIAQLQSAFEDLNKQCSAASRPNTILRCATCIPQQFDHCTDKATNPQQPQFVPDFNVPLIAAGGGDHRCDILEKLGPIAGLIGTWVSTRYGGFNVMPIPQDNAPNGFILKNFPYYEVMTFSAIQGKVANRAGNYEQDAYSIFYSQRVFFADGPEKDTLVHAENGSWLHQVIAPQGQGTLNKEPWVPDTPNPLPEQEQDRTIVKQVSIPHGNSILAIGHHDCFRGAPSIPVANALPTAGGNSFKAPYGSDIPENPNVNPNIVLQVALDSLYQQDIGVIDTTVLDVDTDTDGDIANTPFMKAHSDVPRFKTTLWLQRLSNGLDMLQYTQDITLDFRLANGKDQSKRSRYKFPHITANTLFKVQ